jgi:hypothetical protein
MSLSVTVFVYERIVIVVFTVQCKSSTVYNLECSLLSIRWRS